MLSTYCAQAPLGVPQAEGAQRCGRGCGQLACPGQLLFGLLLAARPHRGEGEPQTEVKVFVGTEFERAGVGGDVLGQRGAISISHEPPRGLLR